MGIKNKLSVFLVLDILAMVILFLFPSTASTTGAAGSGQFRNAVMILLAAAALVLIFLISRRREKDAHVQVVEVSSASQINPAQYLSKGGPVCAGSDGRYHVTFLMKDDTKLTLSLSAKQAGTLATGMQGTLIRNGSVFIGFTPE